MSSADAGSTGAGAFARLRRNKGIANVSSTSLNSSSGDGEEALGTTREATPDTSRGLRASIDGALERVRGRRSVDARPDIEDGSEGRLTAIVSKTRRRMSTRRGREYEPERAYSVSSLGLAESRSESSLVLDGSRSSSLLTDDEKVDDTNQPIRPSLSPHQSHAGLLTFSSPELNAQTTVASQSATSFSNTPLLVEPVSTTDTLSAPSIPNRSPSPADKFRGKFLSRKKSRDTESVKSAGEGGGGGGGGGGRGSLGALFKASGSRERLVSRSTKSEQPPPPLPAKTPRVSAIDTGQDRPETPQQWSRALDNVDPSTPPNLLRTPTTLVTPPTPTLDAGATHFRSTSPTKNSPAARSLSSVESIKHRRAQSATLPSKLSTSLGPPLATTIEETNTPGGTLTQQTPAESSSGFFTSFFSAAQKTAGNLGNTINTSILPGQKSKATPTPQPVDAAEGGEEVIPGLESRPATGLAQGQDPPRAIETLGKGDLNFSHLGISAGESNTMSVTNETTVEAHFDGAAQTADRGRKAEEDAAARAVSSAYERPIATVISQATGSTRPPSVTSNEKLTLGEQSPQRSTTLPEGVLIKRSGSVRSKLSGRRKHRGSSGTAGTSNSIAAALTASTTGLANPGVHGVGHRLTGFAVASSKRNKDFHQLFRSVPEDDYLIEDYSAALQRDILLHGRLYVSEGHVCFSSNILGWVTNLVISFDEVVSIEKKSTAVIFPNAIVISTLQARNVFASFVARDSTYELLIGIWKISHPNLKSSLNGVMLDNAGTGDKTEVAEIPEEDEATTDGSDDEVYDEDADDDAGSFTDGGMVISDAGSNVGDLVLSRKTSAAPIATPSNVNGTISKPSETPDQALANSAPASDHPGPATHEPTECTEASEHYDRPLTDTTIAAPLGKVYTLMFGPASGAFMKRWLVEDQKSRELNYEDDKTGLDNDHKSFTFDYIKPLSAPVGPKQTKCITTITLRAFDLERAVSVDCSTATPDVPSGGSFTTKTRYCLMWGPNNSTRLITSCTIDWTAKSWLKGAIEKGANDGQIEYMKGLVAALKAACTTKAPSKGPLKRGKRKGKRDNLDVDETNAQRETVNAAADQKSSSWGLLEPIRPLLDPVVSIFRPFISSELVIIVLFALLAYNWLFSSRNATAVSYAGHSTPERIAAYEEIWRREESALWDWLDDRVGLDGMHAPQLGREKKQQRQQVLSGKKMDKRLEDSRMTERQMDDAIKTTEEKLAALKDAVKRQKGQGRD